MESFEPLSNSEFLSSMDSLPASKGDYPMSGNSSQLDLDMPSADAVEMNEIITSCLKDVDCSIIDVTSLEMEHLSINDEEYNELVGDRKLMSRNSSAEMEKKTELEKEMNSSSLKAENRSYDNHREEKMKNENRDEINRNMYGVLTGGEPTDTDNILNDIADVISSTEHCDSNQEFEEINNQHFQRDNNGLKTKVLDFPTKQVSASSQRINVDEKNLKFEDSFTVENRTKDKVVTDILYISSGMTSKNVTNQEFNLLCKNDSFEKTISKGVKISQNKENLSKKESSKRIVSSKDNETQKKCSEGRMLDQIKVSYSSSNKIAAMENANAELELQDCVDLENPSQSKSSLKNIQFGEERETGTDCEWYESVDTDICEDLSGQEESRKHSEKGSPSALLPVSKLFNRAGQNLQVELVENLCSGSLSHTHEYLQERGGSRYHKSLKSNKSQVVPVTSARPILPKTTPFLTTLSSTKPEPVVTNVYPVRIHRANGGENNKLCLEVCHDLPVSIPSVVHDVINDTSLRKIDVDGPVSQTPSCNYQQQHAITSEPTQNWQTLQPSLQQDITVQTQNQNYPQMTTAINSNDRGMVHIISEKWSHGSVGNKNTSVLCSKNKDSNQMVTNAIPPKIPYRDLILADRNELEKLGVPYQCISAPNQGGMHVLNVNPGRSRCSLNSAVQSLQPNQYGVEGSFSIRNDFHVLKDPTLVNVQQPTHLSTQSIAGQQQLQKTFQKLPFFIPDQVLLEESNANTSQHAIGQESNSSTQLSVDQSINLTHNNISECGLNLPSQEELQSFQFDFSNEQKWKSKRTNIQLQQPKVSFSEKVANKSDFTRKQAANSVSGLSGAALEHSALVSNTLPISSCQHIGLGTIPNWLQTQKISGSNMGVGKPGYGFNNKVDLQPSEKAHHQLKLAMTNRQKPKRLRNQIKGMQTVNVMKNGVDLKSISSFSSHSDANGLLSKMIPMEDVKSNSNNTTVGLIQEIECGKEIFPSQNFQEGLPDESKTFIMKDMLMEGQSNNFEEMHVNHLPSDILEEMGACADFHLPADLNVDMVQYLGLNSLDKSSNDINSISLEKYLNIPISHQEILSSVEAEAKFPCCPPSEIGHIDIQAWRQQAFETEISHSHRLNNNLNSAKVSKPENYLDVKKVSVSTDPLKSSNSVGGGDRCFASASLGNGLSTNISNVKGLKNLDNVTNNSKSSNSDLQNLTEIDLLPSINQQSFENHYQLDDDMKQLWEKQESIPLVYGRLGVQSTKSIQQNEVPSLGFSSIVAMQSNEPMQSGGILNNLSPDPEGKLDREISSIPNVTGGSILNNTKTKVFISKPSVFQNRSTNNCPESKAHRAERKRSRRQGQSSHYVADWVNNVNRDWSLLPSPFGQPHLQHEAEVLQSSHKPPHQIQGHQQHHLRQRTNGGTDPQQQSHNHQSQNYAYCNISINRPVSHCPPSKTNTNDHQETTRIQSSLPNSLTQTISSLSSISHSHNKNQPQTCKNTRLVPRGSCSDEQNSAISTKDVEEHMFKSSSLICNAIGTPSLNKISEISLSMPLHKSSRQTLYYEDVKNPKTSDGATTTSTTYNLTNDEICVSHNDSDMYIDCHKGLTSEEYQQEYDSDLYSSGTSSLEAKRRWLESLGIDEEEDSPLHYLCDMPQSDSMLKKIQSNQNFHKVINHLNNRHETALFVAVMKQNPHIVQFLVQNGADVNIICKSDPKKYHRASCEYQTALHEAVETGNRDITQILLCADNINPDSRRQVSCITPLMLALSCHSLPDCDYVEIVKMLLRQDASLETQDAEGRTPLMYLVMSGDVQLVGFIFDHVGVQAARSLVTAVSKKKQMSCLHYAAGLKDRKIEAVKKKELLKLLIEHGADPDKLNTDRQSPRHWASNEIFEVMSQLKTMTDGNSAKVLQCVSEEEKIGS